MWFSADLHIHSCLSPCGDLASSPRAIARRAREAGLDAVALTDHNTALNAPAFESACRGEGITGIYGMELTTREDIHVLTLFPTVREALAAGADAYERLNSSPFDPAEFGDQVWVNEAEEIEGSLEKLLILGATDLSLEDAGIWCRQRGGLLIPAHINRPSFGILGRLGFLPEGPFDAVECTTPLSPKITNPWPVTASSDAHYVSDIGRRYLKFNAASAGFDGLREALSSSRVEAVYGS